MSRVPTKVYITDINQLIYLIQYGGSETSYYSMKYEIGIYIVDSDDCREISIYHIPFHLVCDVISSGIAKNYLNFLSMADELVDSGSYEDCYYLGYVNLYYSSQEGIENIEVSNAKHIEWIKNILVSTCNDIDDWYIANDSIISFKDVDKFI